VSEVTAKAVRVHRLLEDQDLQDAFSDVERALFERFRAAPTDNGEILKELKLMHTLLDSVKANLYMAIKDGKLEQFNEDQSENVQFLGDIRKWRKKQNKQQKNGSTAS
jgi:hypothetical protein